MFHSYLFFILLFSLSLLVSFVLVLFLYSPFTFFFLSFLLVSSRPGIYLDPTQKSAISMDTSFGVPNDIVNTLGGVSFPAIIFRSEVVYWTVTVYKSKYADGFDIRRFNAIFSDGLYPIMYDWRGVKRDTSTGGWNQDWNLMQARCIEYLDHIGHLIMLFMHHEDESNYVLWLAILNGHAEEVKRLM